MSGVAAAARALVGARFRLHGRDPADGLDCVGVVACATGLAVPTGYALRGGVAARAIRWLDVHLVRSDDGGPGEVLLLRAGPGQLHLGVRVAGGIVHGDAGLRRVVERPGPVPWPILGGWRVRGDGNGDVGAGSGGIGDRGTDRRRAGRDAGQCGGPRGAGPGPAAGAAADRVAGADIVLWHATAQAVRDDAGRRHGDLVDRPDRDARG